MAEKQRTLKSAVKLTGVGLHTGEKVTLEICPAPENHGYKFQRIDLEGEPVIKADADLVVATDRGTTLEFNGARVYTTEHVLAALYGCQVDNALIKLDGPEVPIMDGSSVLFVKAIDEAGYEDQNADRDYFVLNENIPWEDTERGIEFLAVPDNNYRITVMVDYKSPVLGTQHASMYNIGEFNTEIAKCRTFVFLRELEFLATNNLIKGGDLDNAIVLVDREDVGQEESGNVRFAKVLKEQIKKQEKEGRKFDLTKDPLYNINDIERMLPHRFPFLMVDKIMEIREESIVGVKNITMNEPIFTGHFPGNPVFPGVLQIEAMAQVGGIFALSKVDEPHLYSTYFMKIDNVKFKQKVLPGDTLVFELFLLSPIRRGLVEMGGKAYVNGKVVMEAEMLAQVIKDKA